MKIKLHKCQGTVFQSTSRFKVVAAGRRFGKTVMACAILFTEALKNNGRIYWLVAPTYGQAKELAWDILLKMIPREIMLKDPNESELKITLRNGSTIHLKGADNPDTLVGRGLSGLVIDEVAKIRNHKRVWEEILRPALSDYQGFCLFISTPKGKNYFWELFMKGQKKLDGYESWRFKTEDNPFIPRSEIKAAKDIMSETNFKQEYEASFEDYTGLVWPEFDEKKHVIDPVELAGWWERINAIDTAVSGTTAILRAAIDDSGTLWIYDEFYKQDKRVSEVCEEARKWPESQWIMDPAAKINNQRDQQGKLYSLYNEYVEHGIVARPAENEVLGGLNRVAEYFKSGKIKIFRHCVNLIAELERYHWSEQRETVNGVLKPQPYKSFDHACDCLRYLVMSRPYSPDKPAEPSKGFTVNDYLEQIEDQRNRRNQEVFLND